MRFLIIRLSSIGDIVHALPAVAALGGAYPKAEIYWAIEKRYSLLLDGNPFVRGEIPFDTLGWRSRLGSAHTWEEVRRSIGALRERAYDAAIDFQGLIKSGFIAAISGARERWGFAESWLREPSAGVFYTGSVSPRGRRHVIEMNLRLVECLGVPELAPVDWRFPLPCHPADDEDVEKRLASLGAESFMIINPGGGWVTKRWPPDNYVRLVRRLAERQGGLKWKILLTGSRDEEEMNRGILEGAGTKQAAYFASTLTQFIALARRARLFVGGDTGPLHLAAAVGTPIVALYGPTDWVRNGPFGPVDITLSNTGPIDYTRRARNAAFLAGISVESVLEAILRRVANSDG